MKVFIYTKGKNSRKIATITDVEEVTEIKNANTIVIETYGGVAVTFNTKEVKTTIYQN